MKKRTLLILLLILAVSAAMLLSGCSKAEEPAPVPEETAEEPAEEPTEEPAEEPADTAMSLEEYMAANPEVWNASVASAQNTQGLTIEVKDNTIFYYYDLSQMGGGYTKDTAMQSKDALDAAMENMKSTFGGVCQTLEGATGVEGIHTNVCYLWEDEIITSMDFTTADKE